MGYNIKAKMMKAQRRRSKEVGSETIILILMVLLVIQAIGALLMRNAAVAKGYGDEVHAWAACFWLGILGYLYVIALPDKVAQSQNQQLIDQNQQLISERMASVHNDKLSKMREKNI